MLPMKHLDLVEKEAADMLKSSTDSLDIAHLPLLKDGKTKADKVNEINDNSIINNSKTDDEYYDDTYYDYDEVANATTSKSSTSK